MSLRLLLIVSLLSGLAGCAAQADPADWARAAARESDAADEALERGDRAVAARRLEALLALPVPAGVARGDVRVVQQDAYARLANLALESGDADGALRLARDGLALGEAEDLFTAELLVARGAAQEARGLDREAARDYHRASILHETLLERTLSNGAPR